MFEDTHSIIDIEDEQRRRDAIRQRAAEGARLTLKQLAAEAVAPGRGKLLPPLIRHLRPHNATVPLPALPRVPKQFQQMTNNARPIIVAMLSKYGIDENRLLRHDPADLRAQRCRRETAYRLLRFGRDKGLALSTAVVGQLLQRHRATVVSAAKYYAAEKGFEL